MRNVLMGLLAVLAVLALAFPGTVAAQAAKPQARVEVALVDSFPSGGNVAIQPDRNVYLRIAYETDRPARIFVRPYYRGEQVRAGSNPSPLYSGKGELLAWFFLQAGAQVDEIRVSAGNGSPSGTVEVARWPLRVFAYSTAPAPAAEPPWVAELGAVEKGRLEASREAEAKALAAEPTGPIFDALMLAFPAVFMAIGIVGLAWPAWAVWRWRDTWRWWALAPLLVLGFVVLRIVVDTALDPTSHNLWPLEIIMFGGASLLAMLVISLLRWWSRRRPA